VTLDRVTFEGHECVRLADEVAAVLVTVSAGPRVLGLVGREGNLMAVLPEAGLDLPGGGRFRLLGGHRLWAAPEVPAVTYQPDERPCAASEVEGGVRVEAPVDGAGFAKAIEVRRTATGWTVDHVLRNESAAPVQIAPWAITQLRLGGEAELPMGPAGSGPQADRALVLWPYTDPGDPRIRIGRDAVRIRAEPTGPTLKVGAAPSEGRASYRLGDVVFEKRAAVDPSATYPDRGAAVHVYLCDEFCELETLGPLRTVEPGDSASHREEWRLLPARGGSS
jgi:hypothetical protein